MFKLLLKWLLSFFTADKVGVLVRLLLAKAGTVIGNELLNPENQKKAFEFVKELNKDEKMTGVEKAAEFNKKMLVWSISVGKKLSMSVINCLREMAVVSLKD
jgi:hypothetical protein